MKDDEIMARIARICGYEIQKRGDCDYIGQLRSISFTWTERVPNYHSSYDDMHLALQCIQSKKLWKAYLKNLTRITKPHDRALASPRQQAQAFLETFGQWEAK